MISAADKELARSLTGQSIRDAATAKPLPGRSRANLGRKTKGASEEFLEELNGRRFESVPIVAAYLDGTALGVRNGKAGVMAVIGITADGQKVALAAAMTPHEREKDVSKLLKSLVERGIDPRILWISDHGSGIEAALKELHPEGKPNLQVCTVHVARNLRNALVGPLSKKEKKRWSGKLWAAWNMDDVDAARAALETVVEELKTAGQDAAAASLEKNLEGSLTVQKLGFTGVLLEQLRTNNLSESSHRANKRDADRWTSWDDDRRLRYVATRMLKLEDEGRWTQLAEPEQLIGWMETLWPGRYDAEQAREQLAPSVNAKQLVVSLGDDDGMQALATSWCAEHPEAVWAGPPRTLAVLGLDPKSAPSAAELVTAMRCQDRAGKNKIAKLDRDEELPETVLNASWELVASPAVMKKWREGGAAAVAAERWLMESASTGIAALTAKTRENEGYAGIMALQRPPAENPGAPLKVVGIAFGAQRGIEPKLQSDAAKAWFEPERQRLSERAAKATIDARLAQDRSQSAATREAYARPANPELIAATKARAMEIVPAMVAAGDEELAALSGEWKTAKEGLDEVAGDVFSWGSEQKFAAALQIAAARAQPPPASDPDRGLLHPLSEEQMRVLGAAGSQWLLGQAARLQGRAEVDARWARELRQVEGDAFAGLQAPLEKVERAARSLAAKQEVERRRQFDLAKAGSGPVVPVQRLRDSSGRLGVAPLEGEGGALSDNHAATIEAYATAITEEIRRELSDDALRRLATATAPAWERFHPTTAKQLQSLERNRDATLRDHLRASWRYGSQETLAARAEANRDGSAIVDTARGLERAASGVHGGLKRLRDVGKQISIRQSSPGSPDSLVLQPEAAIHQAACFVLRRRELGLESEPGAEITTTPTREAETACMEM